jgi:hypothetical protein
VRFAERVEQAQFRLWSDALGTTAAFKMFAGECPADCESPDPPGAVLVEIALGPHPFQKREGELRLTEGLIGKGTEAAGRGKLARSFRFFDANGSCVLQGSVTPPGDDGDMLFDNPSIAAAQNVVVHSFDLKMKSKPLV